MGVKANILIVHCSTHNKRENHEKPQAKQFEYGTIGQDMRRLSQSLAGLEEVEREIRIILEMWGLFHMNVVQVIHGIGY